jgi:thiol:disulfide interchange protein DsbD
MNRFALPFACCLFATAAQGAGTADEPLDPGKAFRLSIGSSTAPAGLSLRYAIVDGYYMYRHRFGLQVVTPGLVLKPPAFPDGETKDDPYFGKTEIYRRYVDIPVAFEGSPQPGRYAVEVTAQGCADSGFCYAPFTQRVLVTVPRDAATPSRPAAPGKP